MPSNYSTDEEDSDSDFSERDVCPKHALGESCTACDATAAIDRQIFEAQVSLAVLRQRRILSLGNMNNVHDPLVSRLPIEVIASIFTAFLPPNVDKRYSIICPEDVPLWETPTTPLVLGAVCKTWRSVVWSTPKLWTSISVDIYHSHDRLVDLVGEWLGRSGRLPLYMQLYAPPECEAHRCDRWASECSSPPRGSEPYIAKLMDVINAYSDRWFYIDLSLPRLYIEQVRFMDGQAQMLNTLKLEAIAVCTIKSPIRDREFGKDLKVAKIPNLRTVCARGFFFHQLDIDFQNLTCIEASKIPAETCLELLQAAPFLTHCIFWDVTCSHNMHDLIQHSSLTCLLVKGFWAEDILRLTNLPELEHLSTCLYRSGAEFEGFIERSGCLLKSVSLDLHLPKECDPEPLISFIRSTMPLSLETLTLDCTYSKSQYFTEQNTLINRVAMANNDPLLPNLKTLRIAVRDPPWNCFLTLPCNPHALGPIFNFSLEPRRYFHIFSFIDFPSNLTYLPDLNIQKNIPSFIENNFGGDSYSRKRELSTSFIDFLRWAPSQYQSLSPLIMRLREDWDYNLSYIIPSQYHFELSSLRES